VHIQCSQPSCGLDHSVELLVIDETAHDFLCQFYVPAVQWGKLCKGGVTELGAELCFQHYVERMTCYPE
jgi:hypothetical protein